MQLLPGSTSLELDRLRVDAPILIDAGRTPMVWRDIDRDGGLIRAVGVDPSGRVQVTLRVRQAADDDDPGASEVRLRWRLDWLREWTGALEFPLHLAPVGEGPPGLFLPSIHDDVVVGGTGIHPRLDLVRGFAVRTDRLPQVGVVITDAAGATVLLAPDETPRPARAGCVLAVLGRLEEGRLRLAMRYPQAEWGHVAEPPDGAYLAKGSVGAGEDRRVRWCAGERTRLALGIVRASGMTLAEARGIPARRQWARRHPRWLGAAAPAEVAAERQRWVDAHLWSSKLGQFISPEGSSVAMLGFVEMSLHAAVVAARLALVDEDRGQGLPDAGSRLAVAAGGAEEGGPQEPRTRLERALGALDSWTTDGVSESGLLLPVRSPQGFGGGRRDYAEASTYEVEDAAMVEPMRVLTEARTLLGLVRHAEGAGLGPERAGRYRLAAARSADALLARMGAGGLPGLIALDGGEGPRDGAATAGLVALLADVALDAPDPGDASRWTTAAWDAHRRLLLPALQTGRFGGVTLDASAPDREGILAALEAALALHEHTQEPGLLVDARTAVDALLAYVFTYPIRTFGPETDAAVRRISTVGASTVSPENQHLDPFPVGTALLRYGLMAGDSVAISAGIANIAFCLDGRWAFSTPDGSRQSEQLNHTAWHYTHWFAGRGDIRIGMPRYGRVDSEHGWSQVLPVAAWLELGDVTVDWPTGHAAALDRRRRPTSARSGGALTIDLGAGDRAHTVLLRLLRPPHGGRSRDQHGGRHEDRRVASAARGARRAE